MTKLPLVLLAAGVTAGSVSAFTPTVIPQLKIQRSPSLTRSLPVVQSAKVLPLAYASASAALLYRATKAATKADKAVLVATAVLSLFNLGPSDNVRLASAKKADKIYPPCTPQSQHRKNAEKWRSLVRIKLVGQLLGLVWMAVSETSVGVMRGAAIIMATNMLFFILGSGRNNHDKDGFADPMPASKSRGLLTIDTVLTVAALVASASPVGSTRYAVCAGIFAGRAAIGGLEGLAVLVASGKK